ncbi:hypothetical protein ACMD2_15879 [Ananas comosus]|uniref:Embryo-specific protein ATS3B n=1 Tax=Ananas comosus TaxID=4615 RepID=A0A199V660_ANACO|nr:hypothetical protein ACMD2_15879 [Ananas comosus]
MVKLLLPKTLLHVLSLQFLLLLLLLCVSWGSSVVVSSGSEIVADHPPPHELRSFTIRENLQKEGEETGRGRGSCSYTVKIRTSCSSPRITRDAISLAFGDLYRNEVYVPRLDDPSSGTFERCSTDTFKIKGPCGYGVCYLYLRRNGWDGWIPEWVQVYDPYYSRTVTFYYSTSLPNGVWYGFNQCPRATQTGTTAADPISRM